MALKESYSWTFNAMSGSTWIQLSVSITENTIKYQTGPYTTQEIKLKHSVKDHIPLINKYASYVRLNECRQASYGGCYNYIGDTNNCIMDLVEFISMLGEISSKTQTLCIKNEELSKEKETLCIKNEELRKENELLKEYKQKKD